MVPTVIERSSWTDRTMPVRMYWIDPDEKHKAVRLVYRMGSNEYWGVQMTDWDDAPVLADKSHTRRIKGRIYDLYYDGPKLHMVVLRTKHARYWVVNTLLDRLSNETMLAIAKGLKPMARGSSRVRIAVFGAGYVGLVTGACLAELGHDVVVRDIVSEKIDALRRGEVPIHEEGLAELLARNRERLTFTTEVAEALEGAEVVYVAVGTPPTRSGDADLTAVWTVVDELPAVDRRVVLAMKSTVPVGTGRTVRHRLDERGLENVGYVSNPEFTAEGTAVHDFMHPDRIVIGAFDMPTRTSSSGCTPASTRRSSAATSRPPR